MKRQVLYVTITRESGSFVIAYYPVTKATMLPNGKLRLVGYWGLSNKGITDKRCQVTLDLNMNPDEGLVATIEPATWDGPLSGDGIERG